jgi:hypothetical protein
MLPHTDVDQIPLFFEAPKAVRVEDQNQETPAID